MQDKELHRLKGLSKARHSNGIPEIVPNEKNASKIGGAQVFKKLSPKSVLQYIKAIKKVCCI